MKEKKSAGAQRAVNQKCKKIKNKINSERSEREQNSMIYGKAKGIVSVRVKKRSLRLFILTAAA
jgi:hypothetical protein